MENLETGKDKIKQICQILKNETLQPAKEEAQQILEVAQQEAQQIIKNAEAKASELLTDAKANMAKERTLFDSSLAQAAKQGVEALRQNIEDHLFNGQLASWVESETADPDLCAKLVTALVETIEKEGVSADFSALIPQKVPAEKVNALLGKHILEKLKERSVVVAEFVGGVALKLHDKRLVLDISDDALKELLGSYIRKDFREHLFQG